MFSRKLRFALVVSLGLLPTGFVSAETVRPLSVDDVSWLFPPPQSKSDVQSLIAISDVMVSDPNDPTKRVAAWSENAFQDFLRIADSEQAAVTGPDRIGLPAEARLKEGWFIAGIRIDAGAPGLSPQIIDIYGRRPQIRIILQPIRDPSGTPKIDDVAAHLIFDFVKPVMPPADCSLHAIPDDVAFQAVINDLAALKAKLAAGTFGAKISTAGVELGIHPGLANPITRAAVSAAMKAFLQRHVSDLRLGSMAVMGLPKDQPAPWIFLSMLRLPTTHRFEAVLSPALDGTQFAIMLQPFGVSPRVVPTPHANNLAPITCSSGVAGLKGPPIATRKGDSTSEILDPPGQPQARVADVTDLISDPSRSHFFNTDCVSCHTETRALIDSAGSASITGISADVLPNGAWDVRNFGWSVDRVVQGSVARRTLRETRAVVDWINANSLGKQ